MKKKKERKEVEVETTIYSGVIIRMSLKLKHTNRSFLELENRLIKINGQGNGQKRVDVFFFQIFSE